MPRGDVQQDAFDRLQPSRRAVTRPMATPCGAISAQRSIDAFAELDAGETLSAALRHDQARIGVGLTASMDQSRGLTKEGEANGVEDGGLSGASGPEDHKERRLPQIPVQINAVLSVE